MKRGARPDGPSMVGTNHRKKVPVAHGPQRAQEGNGVGCRTEGTEASHHLQEGLGSTAWDERDVEGLPRGNVQLSLAEVHSGFDGLGSGRRAESGGPGRGQGKGGDQREESEEGRRN